MTKRITTPEQAFTVTTYDELHRFVQAFADGHLNLLILVGSAGIAKSQSVRRAVGEGACWIEGNATPFGIYTQLYKHRGELIVIDDVDSLNTDRSAVRLLKCLCQTDPEKSIAWHSAAAGTDDIPRQFQTSSRVVILLRPEDSWRRFRTTAPLSSVPPTYSGEPPYPTDWRFGRPNLEISFSSSGQDSDRRTRRSPRA